MCIRDSPWEVRQGPFSEAKFASLPETHWSLLVQDVDKHVPEAGRLLEAFRFLPSWRIDDIMISFAPDQGSAGPHVDDYDVFLVQAWGRRRWRIHTRPVPEDEFIPGLDLRILADFLPEREWLLAPGDVLYLPPGVAHWGLAEGDCMTWSVGFRAPSWRELATAWSEHLIERRMPPGRYRDPGLRRQRHHAEICPDVLVRVGDALDACLAMEPSELRRWFGCFSTEVKEQLQVYPAERPVTALALATQLEAHRMLRRNDYSRLAFSRGDEGTDYLFANGTCYALASELGGFLPALTRSRELPVDRLRDWLDRPACLELLCQLINAGHFTLEHD